MKDKFDILFLVESGIGNTLEVLYAVEYCLKNKIRAGLVLNKINASFFEYIKRCYGDDVIMAYTKGISTRNLVHSFTYESQIEIEHDNYFYIYPDVNSTKYLSETEQSISIARALYPSSHDISPVLNKLIEERTDRVNKLNIENKYVIYSGCSSSTPQRRWPLYSDLMTMLGKDNVVFIGGLDDLNVNYSYIYNYYITKLFPRQISNKKFFWNICKKLNLLDPFSHNNGIAMLENSYFNVFNWGEMVAILKNCKGFIGNDGGLMHLASSAGAKGVAIFGPSSVKKNKSYNPDIKEIFKSYLCQPCQFTVDGISMSKYYISCPYQVKCLADISCNDVLALLGYKL